MSGNKQVLYDRSVGGARLEGPGVLRVGAAPEGASGGLAARALALGGEVARALGREYAAGQTRLVDEALLAVDREFEEWKQEYMRTRRGRDALEAQADFAARWDELARGALAGSELRTNETFRGALKSRLFQHGLYAARDGGAWQARQTEVWEKSQWESQEAAFFNLIRANPMDGEAIEFEKANLLASWRAKNPGQDSGAVAADLGKKATLARLEELKAQDRLDEMEAVLAGQAGGADIRGMTPEVERLVREAAQRHGVDPELCLAMAMQESGGNQAAVSRAGARGIMQLMPGTARDLGVDPDDAAQNVDAGVRYLKAQLQRFGDTRHALMAYNWGPGNVARFLAGKAGAVPVEAREYADRVLGRIRGHGLAASERAPYEKYIRDGRQRAASLEGLDAIDRLIGQSAGLDMAERASMVYEELARIQEPRRRLEALRMAEAQLAFEKKRQDAADEANALELCKLARDMEMTPLQAMRFFLERTAASPRAGARARQLYLGGETRANHANRAALNQALVLVDTDRLQSQEERQAFAINNNLTAGQTEKLLAYDGKAADLPMSRALRVARSLGLDSESLPEGFYDALKAMLPPGKKPSDAELERHVATLLLPGHAPGFILDSSYTLFEASEAGRLDAWLPDVSEREEPELDRQLLLRGLQPSARARASLKREKIGLPPLAE